VDAIPLTQGVHCREAFVDGKNDGAAGQQEATAKLKKDFM
jgi:hypothetical protein